MKKIRIAQIGQSCTTHGAPILDRLLKMNDVFEVVGCADVDVPLWKRNPIFQSVPQMTAEQILEMPDLDAVAIECDEMLQTKYAILAAERGLPIHLEKPGGESDGDFDRLIDIVEKNQTVFHTSYMYRYNPAIQYALEKVRSGALGEIYSVEAQMNCFHTEQFRQWFRTFRGGIMYYLGCHLVDLIYQIQGMPEEIIPLNTSISDIPSNDFGMAVFRYKNGSSFAKVSGLEPGGFLRRQLVICGTKGTIETRPLERPIGNDMDNCDMIEHYHCDATYDWGHDEGIRTTFPAQNRYDTMMLNFAAMVRGEKTNPYSYEYERQLHKLLLKACGY